MDIINSESQTKLGYVIENLKLIAKKTCWQDTFDEDDDSIVDDYAGGNIDDAYSGGIDAGGILLAREILNDLGIEWQ